MDFLFLLLKDLVKYLLLDITSSKKQFFSQATGLEIRKSVIIAQIMQRSFLWGEEFFFFGKEGVMAWNCMNQIAYLDS